MNLKLNLVAITKNHCPAELAEIHTHMLWLKKFPKLRQWSTTRHNRKICYILL